MVELNFDLMKTIQSLQVDLQSFKDENMNERKEKKAINEDLLQNMMIGNPHGQPTHLTNKSKEDYHRCIIPNFLPNNYGNKYHCM